MTHFDQPDLLLTASRAQSLPGRMNRGRLDVNGNDQAAWTDSFGEEYRIVSVTGGRIDGHITRTQDRTDGLVRQLGETQLHDDIPTR